MSSKPRRLRRALAGLVVLVAAGAGAFWYLRLPATTPVMRGGAIAMRMGCFSCHGPGGRGGVPNPGSPDGEVPAWDGGMLMMFIESEDEIAEWILYGQPKRVREQEQTPGMHDHGHGDEREPGQPEEAPGPGAADAGTAGSKGQPLLHMPAYEGRLSGEQLADLVHYVKAVANYGPVPPPPARKGFQVAARLGCFGCHGPQGRGTTPNPGAFKGVIPPWDGADFEELVRSDEELRAWILDGRIRRFEEHPIARRFTRAQVIQMPAYRAVLQDGELESLMAYLEWLRQPER